MFPISWMEQRLAEGGQTLEHVFQMVSPTGSVVVPNTESGDRTITITSSGTYTYFCNNSLCGTGHPNMVGDFTVGTDPGTGRGY